MNRTVNPLSVKECLYGSSTVPVTARYGFTRVPLYKLPGRGADYSTTKSSSKIDQKTTWAATVFRPALSLAVEVWWTVGIWYTISQASLAGAAINAVRSMDPNVRLVVVLARQAAGTRGASAVTDAAGPSYKRRQAKASLTRFVWSGPRVIVRTHQDRIRRAAKLKHRERAGARSCSVVHRLISLRLPVDCFQFFGDPRRVVIFFHIQATASPEFCPLIGI